MASLIKFRAVNVLSRSSWIVSFQGFNQPPWLMSVDGEPKGGIVLGVVMCHRSVGFYSSAALARFSGRSFAFPRCCGFKF